MAVFRPRSHDPFRADTKCKHRNFMDVERRGDHTNTTQSCVGVQKHKEFKDTRHDTRDVGTRPAYCLATQTEIQVSGRR